MSFTHITQTVKVGGLQYLLSNMPAGSAQEAELFFKLQDLEESHVRDTVLYSDFSNTPTEKSPEHLSLEKAVRTIQRQWQSIQIGFSPFSEEVCKAKAKSLSYFKLLPDQADPRHKLHKVYAQLLKTGVYVDAATFTVYIKRYANAQGAPLRIERYSLQNNTGLWDLTYSYVEASEQIWEDLEKDNALTVDHLASGYWTQGYPVEDAFWDKKKAKNAFHKLVKFLKKA